MFEYMSTYLTSIATSRCNMSETSGGISPVVVRSKPVLSLTIEMLTPTEEVARFFIIYTGAQIKINYEDFFDLLRSKFACYLWVYTIFGILSQLQYGRIAIELGECISRYRTR